MYNALPKRIKEKVKELLMSDNFVKAKSLHDAWFSQPDSCMNDAFVDEFLARNYE